LDKLKKKRKENKKKKKNVLGEYDNLIFTIFFGQAEFSKNFLRNVTTSYNFPIPLVFKPVTRSPSK